MTSNFFPGCLRNPSAFKFNRKKQPLLTEDHENKHENSA